MIYDLRFENFREGHPLMGKMVKVLEINRQSNWYNDRDQLIGMKVKLDPDGFVPPKGTMVSFSGGRPIVRDHIGCCSIKCVLIEDDPDDNY